MDVANEAPAPDPEPAVAPSDAAPGDAEAPSTEPGADAPPAEPEAAPPALAVDPPAPPAPSTELEDAAIAFKPTPFRTIIAAPFWAGLLGAGVALWAGSTLQTFSRAYLIPRPPNAIALFVPLLLAIGVALARGYRTPVQGYASLVGRLLGGLFFGGLSGLVTVLILAVIFNGMHVRDLAGFTAVALAGALLVGLAVARLYGVATEKSRRIKTAAAVAAALLVTLWPSSPSLRCRLGFGEGCRAAADGEDDVRAAASLAARGCEHEDRYSCRLAGLAYSAEGPTRDLRRAEGFYREGCALGDPESCDGVHELELQQRCDRYGAFACAELARAHASGDGMKRDRELAQRYYRKACLLGSDDACREAQGR